MNWKTNAPNTLCFLDILIGLLATWVTICKDMHEESHKLNFKSKFVKQYTQHYDLRNSHYFYNNTEVNNYFNASNVSSYDATIFTDGSYEYDPEEKCKNFHKAGIGVLISNNLDGFLQSIHSQSIFYAETYAIAVTENLLSKLNLSFNNRIEMFCDNQSVFESIYEQSNHELFPSLFSKNRNLIKNHNILIHKVKSHVDSNPKIGNDFADILAGTAFLSLYFLSLV